MKFITLIAGVVLLCGGMSFHAWGAENEGASPRASTSAATGRAAALPPAESEAKGRLDRSPRHGEWIDIARTGNPTPLKSYIVYPERKDKAPVVIVIMEIYGLSDWIRGVADQLAAEGFIAIAPDLLSGKGPNGGGTDAVVGRDNVTALVRNLKPEEVMADLDAVRAYGGTLPAATGKVGTVGFCWGGGMSFLYAARQPALHAAVVYYGTPPADEEMGKMQCPVAGFYGGDDGRVTITVAPTEAKMKRAGKTYLPHVYEKAGHGFLRAQTEREGANLRAAEQAWPATVEFLKKNLEENRPKSE